MARRKFVVRIPVPGNNVLEVQARRSSQGIWIKRIVTRRMLGVEQRLHSAE